MRKTKYKFNLTEKQVNEVVKETRKTALGTGNNIIDHFEDIVKNSIMRGFQGMDNSLLLYYIKVIRKSLNKEEEENE